MKKTFAWSVCCLVLIAVIPCWSLEQDKVKVNGGTQPSLETSDVKAESTNEIVPNRQGLSEADKEDISSSASSSKDASEALVQPDVLETSSEENKLHSEALVNDIQEYQNALDQVKLNNLWKEYGDIEKTSIKPEDTTNLSLENHEKEKKFLRGFQNFNKREQNQQDKRFLRGLSGYSKRDNVISDSMQTDEKRFMRGFRSTDDKRFMRGFRSDLDFQYIPSDTNDAEKRFMRGFRSMNPVVDADKRFMRGFRSYSTFQNTQSGPEKRFMRGFRSPTGVDDKRFMRGFRSDPQAQNDQIDAEKKFMRGFRSDSSPQDISGAADKRFIVGLSTYNRRDAGGYQGLDDDAELQKRFIVGLSGYPQKRFIKGLNNYVPDKRFIKGLNNYVADKRFIKGLNNYVPDKRFIVGLNSFSRRDLEAMDSNDQSKRFMRGFNKKSSDVDKRFINGLGLYSKREEVTDDLLQNDKRFMRGFQKRDGSDDFSDEKRFMRGFNKKFMRGFNKRFMRGFNKRFMRGFKRDPEDSVTNDKRFMRGFTKKDDQDSKRFMRGFRNLGQEKRFMRGFQKKNTDEIFDYDKKFMRGFNKRDVENDNDSNNLIKASNKNDDASENIEEATAKSSDEGKHSDSTSDDGINLQDGDNEPSNTRKKRDIRFNDGYDFDRFQDEGLYDGDDVTDVAKRFMRGLKRSGNDDLDDFDDNGHFGHLSLNMLQPKTTNFVNKRFMRGLNLYKKHDLKHELDKRFIKGLETYNGPSKRFMRGLRYYNAGPDTWENDKRFIRGFSNYNKRGGLDDSTFLDKRFLRGINLYAKRPTYEEKRNSPYSYTKFSIKSPHFFLGSLEDYPWFNEYKSYFQPEQDMRRISSPLRESSPISATRNGFVGFRRK